MRSSSPMMKYPLRPLFLLSLLLCIFFGWFTAKQYYSSSPATFDKSFSMARPADGQTLSDCVWKFDHYEASVWEKFWYDNIITLQQNVCGTLSKPDQMEKSFQFLDDNMMLQKLLFNGSILPKKAELFSKMFYRWECPSTSSVRLISQLIEPLVGLLRDPLTICQSYNPQLLGKFMLFDEAATQAKRFLLLAPSAPYFGLTPSTPIAPWITHPRGRKYLFDVGSSYFNGLKEMNKIGPAVGSRWFYEYFQSISLKFDRIIAFERGPLSPQMAWGQLPDDVVPIFTLINVAVEPEGRYNPLRILEEIVKPEDYVVFKLDIDTFHVEMMFIEQILKSSLLPTLIDELFFEMHVKVNEMAASWGATQGEMKDTYILFTKLRQLGIRMHSWP